MKHPFPEATCKGCGKKIVLAKTEDGKLIPLDPVPPMYLAYEVAGVVSCERVETMTNAEWLLEASEGFPMVTHVATCPQATRFSKAGRDPGR